MSSRRTKLVWKIVRAEEFLREYGTDIIAIGLSLLSIVLLLLEYLGVINL